MTVLLALLRRVPAEVWVGLLLLGAVAVWTWRWYDAGHDAGRAEAADRIAQLEAQVAELTAANAASQAVIDKLKETNRELAEGRAADQQAAAEAVADLRSERDALRVELDRRRIDRGVLYDRDPTAAAWASARVPDAVARSLRE